MSNEKHKINHIKETLTTMTDMQIQILSVMLFAEIYVFILLCMHGSAGAYPPPSGERGGQGNLLCVSAINVLSVAVICPVNLYTLVSDLWLNICSIELD